MTEVEYRAVELNAGELRAGQGDDSIGQIAGYALVFGTPSTNLPFIEVIQPGALDGVDLSDVLALYDHDFANVLGRVSSGTLKLDIDKHGLRHIHMCLRQRRITTQLSTLGNGQVQQRSVALMAYLT